MRERCCKRDNDGDGNCDIHAEPGVYRIGRCPKHCPHDTGNIKPMHPHLKVMVCCYCGAEGHLRPITITRDMRHGPLVPNQLSYTYGNISWMPFRFDRK